MLKWAKNPHFLTKISNCNPSSPCGTNERKFSVRGFYHQPSNLRGWWVKFEKKSFFWTTLINMQHNSNDNNNTNTADVLFIRRFPGGFQNRTALHKVLTIYATDRLWLGGDQEKCVYTIRNAKQRLEFFASGHLRHLLKISQSFINNFV